MSRSRRVATAVVLALVVGGVEWAPTRTATAASPLDDARQAAEATPFVGTLSVEWIDLDGRHSTRLAVRGTGREVRIDGAQPVIATPGGRLVLEAGGWAMIAPDDPSTLGEPPPLSDKFDLTSISGPDVAGRPTTLVDIRTRQGNIDERLYLDHETGLVLRREQIDGGQAVRIVEFTTIQIGPVAQPAALPIHHDEQSQRLRPSALPAPFRAPVSLAAGYALVGVLRHAGIVQAVYSDGLHSLSVFEQSGSLDVGLLPRSGQAVSMPLGQGVRYSWPGGQVITWQSGQAAYTAVGDGPVGDLLAAANSVPRAGRLSLGQRFRSACRRLVVELAGRG
jgi:hypothetical protein